MLIACATAPINVTVDFLFENVIYAPLADHYKVNSKSQSRIGRRVSVLAMKARDAIHNSVSTMVPSAQKKKGKRPLLRKLSASFVEHFTLSEATARQLPQSLVRSHACACQALNSVFFKDSTGHSAPFTNSAPNEKSTLPSTNTCNFVSCYDLAEKGDVWRYDESFDSFTTSLWKQCEQLSGASRVEFQRRWGIDDGMDENSVKLTGYRVPCGETSKVRIMRSMKRNKKRKLKKMIAASSATADDKVHELRNATNVHIGLEILHLFIIDLLG